MLKARLNAEANERLKLSEAVQSANAAAAGHKKALEHERAEAAALARDLQSAREQVEDLMASATAALPVRRSTSSPASSGRTARLVDGRSE